MRAWAFLVAAGTGRKVVPGIYCCIPITNLLHSQTLTRHSNVQRPRNRDTNNNQISTFLLDVCTEIIKRKLFFRNLAANNYVTLSKNKEIITIKQATAASFQS